MMMMMCPDGLSITDHRNLSTQTINYLNVYYSLFSFIYFSKVISLQRHLLDEENVFRYFM